MGFNISGLAINKNYENNFESLQKELGWNLVKQSEIDFETASSNWTEDGICDVYFSEKGTLLFINMDMCIESFKLKEDNSLTFALSETSMAFYINYCENGIEKRSIMEVNDEKMEDEGEKLEIEDKSEDTSEIIWNQIEVVIGKRFWDIEPDEKAVRYIFKKNENHTKNHNNEVKDINKYDIFKPISKETYQNKLTDLELIYQFDKIIKFAQDFEINIFLYPWAHGEHSRVFMNFSLLIDVIKTKSNVLNEIKNKVPIDKFNLFCRFDPVKVDYKTKKDMRNEIMKINNNNNVSNKWWQFWK